jgi:thiol-disulfide isomerase/thioredoxin
MLSARKNLAPVSVLAFLFLSVTASRASLPQNEKQASPKASSKQAAPPRQPSHDEELQQAIDNAGNDRAALVRNLESFLKEYPQAQQRVRIYRALVEASLQLRDTPRAVNYAERIVALSPDDMSMTLLTVQLLEHEGDEAGLRRAVNYSTRVLEFIDRDPPGDKSPKISKQEWEAEKNRDRMTILLLRGRLHLKLHQTRNAEKDFQDSYELVPSAAAAENLGEIAELNKELIRASHEYARAFALADGAKGSPDRREIRRKLGNVWRLAHGSDDGLGDYILRTYDEVTAARDTPQANRNADAKGPYEFTLRKLPDGSSLPLAAERGKILVVNFWATWCGPCRAMEPLFDRVAMEFQQDHDVLFLAADCDEDETLVTPYLQDAKPRTTVVFADGLDRLFGVNSFPTVVVVDRAGKIVYRAEGYGEDTFEQSLTAAIRQALTRVEAAPAAVSSDH